MEPLEYQLQKFQISENTKAARRSNRITLIGFFVTVLVSALTTFFQLKMISSQISSQNNLEFRKTLWSEKKEAYSQTARVVSFLITFANDKKKFDSLYSEFESQYWNVILSFQSKDVETALVALKHDFQIIKDGRELDELDLRALESAFLISCRNSLETIWKDN